MELKSGPNHPGHLGHPALFKAEEQGKVKEAEEGTEEDGAREDKVLEGTKRMLEPTFNQAILVKGMEVTRKKGIRIQAGF